MLPWLQDQRRLANMDASFQRQKIMQAMEKLQANKSWDQVGQGGGMSIDTLLSQR